MQKKFKELIYLYICEFLSEKYDAKSKCKQKENKKDILQKNI